MTEDIDAFSLEDEPVDGVPGVAVHGELDIGTTARLAEHAEAAILASTGAYVVDLCDVSFLDSSGVKLLLRLRALLGREERVLVVVCPPGPPRDVLALVGVAELFALYPTREAAARALVPVR